MQRLLLLSRLRLPLDTLKWNFSQSFLPQARCSGPNTSSVLHISRSDSDGVRGRGGGGEEWAMPWCGRSLGAQGSLKQDWPRAEKVGFFFVQTPTRRLLLPCQTLASHQHVHVLARLFFGFHFKYTNSFECRREISAP